MVVSEVDVNRGGILTGSEGRGPTPRSPILLPSRLSRDARSVTGKVGYV